MRPTLQARFLAAKRLTAATAVGLFAVAGPALAAGNAPAGEAYIPLGVATTDGKNSTAWYLDVARQRVVYCTTAGSLSGAPRCEAGPMPK